MPSRSAPVQSSATIVMVTLPSTGMPSWSVSIMSQGRKEVENAWAHQSIQFYPAQATHYYLQQKGLRDSGALGEINSHHTYVYPKQ